MKSFSVILLAVASVSAAPAGTLRRDVGESSTGSVAARAGILDAFTGAVQGVVDTASGVAGDAINLGARAADEPLEDFERKEEEEEEEAARTAAKRAVRLGALQDFEKEEEAEDAAAGFGTRDLEDFEKEEEAEDAAAGISTRDLEDFEKEEEEEEARTNAKRATTANGLEDFEKEEEEEEAREAKASGLDARAEPEEEECVNEED
ncbi:uncharacterized protein G6M90_00g098860 [Metarhizium brunneum]|uniref:Uncharacterized protein n=1 Tax=Metarhizium brunneum TaxID=500148 RepID=A0A7D5YY38_9HYPO